MINIQNVTIWFYTKDGRLNIEVRCPDCQRKAEPADKGAQERDQLVYVLDCPKCNKTLIEYSSPEELASELSKIVEKWRL